jgi:hypothetical protein
MRDDFTKTDKRILADRVGHFCSNPDCRKRTSGPGQSANTTVNVGVAAHITAASVGGPRYDPTLTSQERKHIENAIWLCQNCGKLVDSDSTRFTVEVLRDWKTQAEREASREIGRPTKPDAALMDARVQRAVQYYRSGGGTPKPEIDTWYDVSDEEKAEWYEKIVFMVRGRPAKGNPYRT